jgi:cytochrome d ubiquinol oxidase subunit II
VPAGGKAGDPVDSWVNPTSIFAGVLAVALAAYLAAVYLVWDARRVDDALVGYFRRRAVVAAVVAAVMVVVGLFVLHADARHVFDGLMSRALPLAVFSAACGAGALVLLVRGATRGARVAAAGAVGGVIGGWGVAQWPYLLPESLTVSAASAPSGTMVALLVAVALAALIVLPGFALLYVLDQKHLLPEEGAADVGERALDRPAG